MVARIASVVLRAAGGLAVVLGLLLWTGNGLGLTRVHMLLGLLVVLSLWVAGVGQALARAGGWPLAGGALLLGLLVLAVGMRQTSLLVGPSHWVVQAAHLLLGVLAIGVGQRCVARWQSGGAQAAEAARPRGAEGEAAS